MSNYLLPLTAGTISIASGQKLIVGTGTLLAAGGSLPGDVVQIGFSFFTVGAETAITNTGAGLLDNFTGYIDSSGAWTAGSVTDVPYKLHRVSPGHGDVANVAAMMAEIYTALRMGFAMQSVSTLTLAATGELIAVVPSGMPILEGARLKFTSRSNVSTRWMTGQVKEYSGTTIKLDLDQKGSGTGTYADWNINITGERGPVGAAATTPGSTTVGHVPTWGDGGGTQLDEGFPVSAYATTILDDANAAAARTTLGLGTAATKNIGTSGDAVPVLNVVNSWATGQAMDTSAFSPVLWNFQNSYNGNGGPSFRFLRSRSGAAAVQYDTIFQILAVGVDAGGVQRLAANYSMSADVVASGYVDGQHNFDTYVGGNWGRRAYVKQGLVVGSPTGGDKGTETINAKAVYDDNTLLTCMAMAREFMEGGAVNIPKWDALVPDAVIPAHAEAQPILEEVTVERVVLDETEAGFVARTITVTEQVQAVDWTPIYDEDGNGIDAIASPAVDVVEVPEEVIPRIHGTARVFQAMLDDGFDPRDPEQYFNKMRADEALPGMPTQADWQHNSLSIGEQFSRKWLAMEMLAIVCNMMWLKLKDHELRIAALEAA